MDDGEEEPEAKDNERHRQERKNNIRQIEDHRDDKGDGVKDRFGSLFLAVHESIIARKTWQFKGPS